MYLLIVQYSQVNSLSQVGLLLINHPQLTDDMSTSWIYEKFIATSPGQSNERKKDIIDNVGKTMDDLRLASK
jgi:hypothetical protein